MEGRIVDGGACVQPLGTGQMQRLCVFRMLGVRKTSTFYEAARELGVML